MKLKLKIRNVIKHFKLITHHKWVVFKLCCKVGEPWRGLVHDLSKYSPTEFWESANYYVGNYSPITEAKKDKGYSEAWLHHKGRNRHHVQYWTDHNAPEPNPIIPYPYAVEMICDKIAAGMIYEGKNWTKELESSYWEEKEKDKIEMNPKIRDFTTAALKEVAEQGIDKTLTKKNMKQLYKKYCES